MMEHAATASAPRAPEAMLALANTCASLAALSREQQRPGHHSQAARLYAEAWQRLLARESLPSVMLAILGEALAATRLGDLDVAALAALGVPALAASHARMRAFSSAATAVNTGLRARLRQQFPAPPAPTLALPACIALQAERPPGARPGGTEADRCLRLGLLAALLAAELNADVAVLFLAGLANSLPESLPALPDALAEAVHQAREAVVVPGSLEAQVFALAQSGGPTLHAGPQQRGMAA